MKQIIAILLLTITFWSCKKDKGTPVQFSNTIDKPITVRIYLSEADYYEETTPLATLSIGAKGRAEAEAALFEEGREYYFDVQGTDSWHSNWGGLEQSKHFSNNTALAEKKIKFQYPVQETIECHGYGDRQLFLGRTGIKTTWKAIGAYDELYFADVWNQMQPYEKDVLLTINKDYSVQLVKRDEQNNSKAYHLRFTLEVLTNLTNNEMYTLTNQDVYTGAGSYHSDTLFLKDWSRGYAYIMVKE